MDYAHWTKDIPDQLTYLQAKKRLVALAEEADQEVMHVQADAILCAALRRLGWQEVVAAFEDLPKWYI